MSQLQRVKISALGPTFRPAFSPTQTSKKWSTRPTNGSWSGSASANAILSTRVLATSDLAVAAVRNLLESHPFDLQEVDLIVVGTVTPDMMYPSTACLVQHKLGIKNTWGFDVSAGCSGFLYALNTERSSLSRGNKESSGDWFGCELVDDRLHGSRSMHHFWRRRGRVLLEPAGEQDGAGIEGVIRSRRPDGGDRRQFLLHAGGGSENPAAQKTVDQKCTTSIRMAKMFSSMR